MKRKAFLAGLALAVLLLAGGAFIGSSPFNGCLRAERGCGQGTNECEYDCPGTMNCVRSGNPFQMCSCTSGTCKTVECPDID
jgi:hypothetical protein